MPPSQAKLRPLKLAFLFDAHCWPDQLNDIIIMISDDHKTYRPSRPRPPEPN